MCRLLVQHSSLLSGDTAIHFKSTVGNGVGNTVKENFNVLSIIQNSECASCKSVWAVKLHSDKIFQLLPAVQLISVMTINRGCVCLYHFY